MRATSIGHAGILIETRQGSIVCDPWFNPAFFASWFVFPRNDRLPPRVARAIKEPDYLYVSHLHGDHLDEAWLTENMRKDVPVLLPGFPSREMERRMRGLGFRNIIRTVDGEEIDLGDGLKVAIHVETSITDGPGGDSALVVSDGEHRLVNQNDCRTGDLGALAAHGPIDLHWLQFSGAIWYPMVYDEPEERMRELVKVKVDSQFARAMRYVESLDARAVVPSAGPPCFLDPDLFGLNVIDGDELSIFPDQREFISRLAATGRPRGLRNIPGTEIELTGGDIVVRHPMPDDEVERIFSDKRAYLREYQADWQPWIDEQRAAWVHEPTDLVTTLTSWWEPLLAMAPTLRSAVGAACLFRVVGDSADDTVELLIDFPAGRVRLWAGDEHDFRFEVPRSLVETVAAARAVDWSDKLFLSCRFKAWRRGAFNEYLYNFFKSLSPERMRRAEAEARRKLDPPDMSTEHDVEMGDYVIERYCPHRQADLTVFGELDGDRLVCTLHGWTFDLADGGRCLTAKDRHLRVRRRNAGT